MCIYIYIYLCSQRLPPFQAVKKIDLKQAAGARMKRNILPHENDNNLGFFLAVVRSNLCNRGMIYVFPIVFPVKTD